MEEKTRFQSEILYDLPLHQEFTKLTTQTYGINVFFRFLTVLCVIYFVPMLQNSYNRWLYFVLCCVIAVPRLLQLTKRKKGDLAWEQTLHRNNGQPPRQQVTLDDEGIHSRSLTKDSKISDPYDQVKYLMESDNLLLIMTKLRMVHIIDKRTLEGGTREELIDFLHQKCPKLKKKIKTGKLHRIAETIMWAAIILGLLLSLAYTLQIPEKLRGRVTNNTPAVQMAGELAELDIHISDRALDVILLWESDDTSLFPKYHGASKVLDLMAIEGMGQYDDDTGAWTPSQSGLYWFDLEVMSVDAIYTDFLTGVEAMDESLTFTNISEDYTNADTEAGIGTVCLSFEYQGQSYVLNAEYDYDWFDTEMLYELGKILNQDEDPKNLWYTTDGQGILLYYGTPEEADALERKTGLYFLDPVENHFYS